LKQKSLKYEEIPPQFISFLEQRGINGRDAVMSFLYPRLDDLPSPQGMKDLTDATELIVKAIEVGRNIVIWGDYDVDGTTATSLLVMFFREIGIEAAWHIPDRVSEGYGLNLNYLRKIADNLSDSEFLLLTVDCGIANAVEISEIQSWGVDVIVTDHHQLQKDSMPSCITINPHQDDCGFSDSHLAGVGVAFYLAAGIRGRLQALGFFQNRAIPNLKSLLAFVALGSVADMVPLRSTNRILVRAGMEALANRQYPGLSALVASAGITDGRIFSEDIGFSLGPRINAAGRMGQSDLAVKVLTCTDDREAERLAKVLSQMNDARKARCLCNLELALSFIDPVQIERDKCCILAGDFHHGTMGITASKLVERLHIPVIICSYLEHTTQPEGRKILKGSCRSVEGIDIFKALDHCKENLISFGGHALAAGISIEAERLNHLRYQLSCYIRQLGDEAKTKRSILRYDIEFPIKLALKNNNIEIFSLMDPFGPDNKKPIFYDSKAIVVEARTIGKKKEHLQLTFRGSDTNLKGIGFSLGEKINRIREKGEYEILYTLSNNRYQDRQKWQPLILDIW
jgi:single-stranded-DNA-specific exonuclease